MKVALLATITMFVLGINAQNASPKSLVSMMADNFKEWLRFTALIYITSQTSLYSPDSQTRIDAFRNLVNAELTYVGIKEAQIHLKHMQDKGTKLEEYYISRVQSLAQSTKKRLGSAKEKMEHLNTQAKNMDAFDKALDKKNKANETYEKNPSKENEAALAKTTAIYLIIHSIVESNYMNPNVRLAEAGVDTYVAAWQWAKALEYLDQTEPKPKDTETQQGKIKLLGYLGNEMEYMVISKNSPSSFFERHVTMIKTFSNIIAVFEAGLY